MSYRCKCRACGRIFEWTPVCYLCGRPSNASGAWDKCYYCGHEGPAKTDANCPSCGALADAYPLSRGEKKALKVAEKEAKKERKGFFRR